jgi:hypothetical protein
MNLGNALRDTFFFNVDFRAQASCNFMSRRNIAAEDTRAFCVVA